MKYVYLHVALELGYRITPTDPAYDLILIEIFKPVELSIHN